MSTNAWHEKFEHIELFSKPALFTNGRIMPETVPEGWFKYDLRGSDKDPGIPETLEARVLANHAGTVLSPEGISIDNGYRRLGNGLNFLGDTMTVQEFCEAHALPLPKSRLMVSPCSACADDNKNERNGKMNTRKGPITTAEFMEWLKDGPNALTVELNNSWDYFVKLPKRDGMDYVFQQDGCWIEPLDRTYHLRFAGIYMRNEQALYCPNIPTRAVSDWAASPDATEENLRRGFVKAVRSRIEAKVDNDRAYYLSQTLTDKKLKASVEKYLDHDVDAVAEWSLLDSVPLENIRYRANYDIDDMGDRLMNYLQDREGFVDLISEVYVSHHSEDILADLLCVDALREKYAALLADKENPLHRMKAVSDAVKDSGAVNVRVTVSKNGVEVTVRLPAKRLTGYHPTYDTVYCSVADRKAFEAAFGRRTEFTAAEIRSITYGKRTIYEAPAREMEQAGSPEPGFTMTMGGM